MFKSVHELAGARSDMTVVVNGIETPAWTGETVGSVLLRVPGAERLTSISETPRLPYCQMGVCFECLAIVNGAASTQGCLIPLRPGMRIESQRGPRKLDYEL